MATCFLTNTNTPTAVLQCSCISCKRTYILSILSIKCTPIWDDKIDSESGCSVKLKAPAWACCWSLVRRRGSRVLPSESAFHGSIPQYLCIPWHLRATFGTWDCTPILNEVWTAFSSAFIWNCLLSSGCKQISLMHCNLKIGTCLGLGRPGKEIACAGCRRSVQL